MSREFANQTFAWLRLLKGDRDFTALAVGVQLIEHFNERDGGVAYPSCKYMAEQLGFHEATVLRAVRRMATRGRLRVEWGRQGRGHPNRYWMIVKPAPAQVSGEENVRQRHRKPAPASQKTCASVEENLHSYAREPLIEPLREPLPPIVPLIGGQAAIDGFGFDHSNQAANNKTGSTNQTLAAKANGSDDIGAPPPRPRATRPAMRAVGVEFDAWWQTYPRREAKGAAEKAYVAARKIATADELLAGATMARQKYTDPKFTPMPATWLNQKRWLDEAPNMSRRMYRTGADYC